MASNSKAEKILKELSFDFSTFSIDTFARHISQRKGREIFLIPWGSNSSYMPAGMFGAWISDGEEPKEYVFYRTDITPIHQIHVQLHELSHILCGHPTLKITHELVSQIVTGKASPPFVDVPKMRSEYKARIEVESESLADLIQERVIRYLQIDQLICQTSSEEKLAHFLKMMSGS